MVLVAVALLVPVPTAVQVRDWATSVGPWFPLAFLAAHIVVTVFPFPRTVFTLAAGLLFGPVLGVTLAVVASAASAVIALLLVRAVGWQFSRVLRHPRVDSLDDRLRQRGWPAILSLRMIPRCRSRCSTTRPVRRRCAPCPTRWPLWSACCPAPPRWWSSAMR
ncbi:hypothetical protein C1Y40_05496 [Mycobacterium talmoniae]|uniref:TVP38/TMEM64 family membrane protein n=1 Tax=Mycobacterium talmoniae TaxID=1858794 RepID=A0A2S8BCH7_9MYCO|nr:hypothetical protein C1Y40_05496 [Mycobacterium talmoniae]